MEAQTAPVKRNRRDCKIPEHRKQIKKLQAIVESLRISHHDMWRRLNDSNKRAFEAERKLYLYRKFDYSARITKLIKIIIHSRIVHEAT